MRNRLLAGFLILLGLLPIGAWGISALAAIVSYQYPASTWSSAAADFGIIVLVLTPAFIGGILMIVGASRLGSRPRGARILASIGLAAVVLTVPISLTYETMNLHYFDIIIAGAYALIHVVLMIWLWRWRPSPL